MILRNGLLSTLRAKGRTALFAVLILLICLSLTLGAGMWAYCSTQLGALDEVYTSIALVEYMGSDYPDEDASDNYARKAAAELDYESLSALDGVELWEKHDSTLANIEGYERQGYTAYSNHAVIEAGQFVELWGEGIVTAQEEDLPESFIAYDSTLNHEARLRTDEFDSGLVPYYLVEDGIYQIDLTSGSRVYYEMNELPESYILVKKNFIEYINHETKKMVLPHSLSSVKMGIEITYNPISNTYEYVGQVVQGYNAITSNILYARDVEGTKSVIVDANGFDFVPQKGRRYTLHGQFVTSNTGHLRFAITDFYEGCEVQPWQDTRDTEADPIFYEYANYYAAANNYVTVEASSDIAALEVFQQDVFRLSEGRFPAAGEEGVCLVSGDIARQMKLTLGDSITVNYFDSDAEDRFDVSANGKTRALEVVGISTMPEDYYGYVWVSDAEGSFGGELYGYQLGRAVLDNASAREIVEAMQAQCPDGVRVTLFDQGYASAAQPLQTMLSTATAVTIASMLCAVSVVFLFAYLFVGRQKETVNVLFSLGTPVGKISLWLLSGAVLISGIASAIGACLGNLVLGRIIELAFSAATEMYAVDSRYSESAVGLVRESVTMGNAPGWPALAAFFLIFLLSLIFCGLFLRLARKQTAPQKGKISVRVPKGGTSLAGRGAFRFALLSARRGGWRSVVVPVVALILSIFLGVLANASAGWSDQMDTLYRDAEINGRATSTNGRRSTEIVLAPENARTLWKSGMVEDISVSIGFQYWFPADMPAFGTGSFAENARNGWISEQPEIVALNGLAAAPEFIYSGTPEVEWLSGWDESFLGDPEACASMLETTTFWRPGALLPAEKEADTIPCIVPKSILDRFRLQLGDSTKICFQYLINSEKHESTRDMIVVGSFQQAGEDANIYAPLTLWCDEDWITGDTDLLSEGQRVGFQFHDIEDRDQYFYFNSRFSTCVFTVSDASRLDELRDYLSENDFTRVDALRSNRTTILLYDRSFVETVSGLGRYISFSELLFPVLFVLVAVLGFIISWLMINSRRMEFAILRSLGASKRRVFMSFFLEQALLCLIGSLLGCIALWIAISRLAWIFAVLVFSLCYIAGSALSVAVVGRTHLMSLLSERE